MVLGLLSARDVQTLGTMVTNTTHAPENKLSRCTRASTSAHPGASGAAPLPRRLPHLLSIRARHTCSTSLGLAAWPATITKRLTTFSDPGPSLPNVPMTVGSACAFVSFQFVLISHRDAGCHLLCAGCVPLRLQAHGTQTCQSNVHKAEFTARSKIASFTTCPPLSFALSSYMSSADRSKSVLTHACQSSFACERTTESAFLRLRALRFGVILKFEECTEPTHSRCSRHRSLSTVDICRRVRFSQGAERHIRRIRARVHLRVKWTATKVG